MADRRPVVGDDQNGPEALLNVTAINAGQVRRPNFKAFHYIIPP